MDLEDHNREKMWQARMAETHLYHTREKVELLRALKSRFGTEVIDVVARVASERARQEWRDIAEKTAGRTLEDLIRLLWEPLRAKGFIFDVDRRADGIQLTCTRCPIADMARHIDDNEWLFHLACGIDPAIAEGFNPALGMRREHTLMEGHGCCDHFYFKKEIKE